MDGLGLTLAWIFDSGMNFLPQAALAFIIGLGFAVRANSGPWMIGLVVLLGITFGSMAVASFNHAAVAEPADGSGETPLKLLTFNVLDRNTQYDETAKYLLEADADVVCLQEAAGEWRETVRPLTTIYPHALESGRGGTILLSKLPFEVLQVDLAAATPTAIGVTLRGLRRPVDLLCLHLPDAGSPSTMALRNQALGHLVRTIHRSDNPFIVLGDFNASTRSPALFRLMQQAGLRTAGPGFPPAHTWPAGFPMSGMRLDHVMFSGSFRLTNHRIGPHLGSSHRPLRADLILAPPPASETG